MDDLKCKKGKVDNKKDDLLIKLQKKIKKKRKSKRKENFKTLKVAIKPNMQKDLGRIRIKGRKGMEGMFCKGLRSEYITRKSLNEANEARKNEDLNKIIDLGRAFLERGGGPGRSLKGVTTCTENRKLEKSPECLRQVSRASDEDLEQCPLSPISFSLSREESDGKFATEPRKPGLEKEFEKFSIKYEEAVGSQVLLRLPEDGVLEDAVKALRKVRLLGKDEPKEGGRGCLFSNEPAFEESREKVAHASKEFQFFTEDFNFGVPETEDLIRYLISPGKPLFSETHTRDDYFGKPLDEMLIMTDVEMENYNHPSFMPSFDRASPNVFHFQDENLESPTKDLSITTPPIQFYRRNMF